MEENNNLPKYLLVFLAGAAAGVALGYFLNSDRKDEMLNSLKESATKLKKDLEENISKAMDMLHNLKKSAASSEQVEE